MKHIYFAIIISVILVGAVYAENQALNNSANEILERLQQNPSEVLQLPDKGTTVSAELALKGIQIKDDNLRESIAEYCINVEQAHPTHAQYKTRSNNYALLTVLVDLFEKKERIRFLQGTY
jgi:hypothetical protein